MIFLIVWTVCMIVFFCASMRERIKAVRMYDDAADKYAEARMIYLDIENAIVRLSEFADIRIVE